MWPRTVIGLVFLIFPLAVWAAAFLSIAGIDDRPLFLVDKVPGPMLGILMLLCPAAAVWAGLAARQRAIIKVRWYRDLAGWMAVLGIVLMVVATFVMLRN